MARIDHQTPFPQKGEGWWYRNLPVRRTRALDLSEAESLVEGVTSGGILGTELGGISLGFVAGILGGLVGFADVGKLVADAVDDDVDVESILLAFGDEGIGGEEGTLISLATGAALDEVDGGNAKTKVETSDG